MLNVRFDVKEWRETVMDKSHDVYLAGLGMYAVVGDEGNKAYHKVIDTSKNFVEKGKKFEKSNKRKNKTWGVQIDSAIGFVGNKVKGLRDTVIIPLGVTPKAEVAELNDKVDKLTDMVVVLAQKLDDSGKKAPAKKTTKAVKTNAKKIAGSVAA